MISRVTNSALMRTAQRNLQANLSNMAKLQDQATSQKLISKPSDDPTGTTTAMAVRGEQRATSQYTRNAANGNNWLTTIDASLASVTTIMNRVRDLTVQGANDGSMSPTAKEAIAVELEGLRSDLLKEANSEYLGRSVYAGNSDAGAAFVDVAGVLTYTGTGSAVERRVAGNSTVRVDSDGAAVFGTGATSIFSLVDNIVGDLRAGVNVGSRLTEIDSRMKTVTNQQADVGARQTQILKAQETLVSSATTLENQRSSIEDVDLGKVILELKQAQVNYQASLQVTAGVLQPTLMDFLN
ncbi:flagellar hook-associated protein FlgL [Leifsonia sp. A12D58]|uniref:flagellar hook-associated protein FlgL n=1 Tax=Leifsonia sp. A12D58 TaxID=3397674 RepID=UPI0039E0E1A1